jgi:hypothetical protein
VKQRVVHIGLSCFPAAGKAVSFSKAEIFRCLQNQIQSITSCDVGDSDDSAHSLSIIVEITPYAEFTGR